MIRIFPVLLPLLMAVITLVVGGCATAEPVREVVDETPAFRLRPVEAARLRGELLEMAERDAYARSRDLDAMGPSERAAAVALIERTDRENAERLWRILRALGWPSRDDVGERGVAAAFEILRHADDPAMQEACLPMLLAAGDRGEISRTSIAYLTDRIMARQGKPQVYGTLYSVRIDADGETMADETGGLIYLLPIVGDPDRLDERRRAMGLGPWAEFEAEMAREQERSPAMRPRTAVVRGQE